MGANHEKWPDWRPSIGEYEGIKQVVSMDGRLRYWRPKDKPGRWYHFGRAKDLAELEVPVREWRLLVQDADAELAGRKRVDDAERVQQLIAEATKGASTKGEERGGYYLREHPGGMAVVCHADGTEMSPPLAKTVAEGILSELAGTADSEGDEDNA